MYELNSLDVVHLPPFMTYKTTILAKYIKLNLPPFRFSFPKRNQPIKVGFFVFYFIKKLETSVKLCYNKHKGGMFMEKDNNLLDTVQQDVSSEDRVLENSTEASVEGVKEHGEEISAADNHLESVTPEAPKDTVERKVFANPTAATFRVNANAVEVVEDVVSETKATIDVVQPERMTVLGYVKAALADPTRIVSNHHWSYTLCAFLISGMLFDLSLITLFNRLFDFARTYSSFFKMRYGVDVSALNLRAEYSISIWMQSFVQLMIGVGLYLLVDKLMSMWLLKEKISMGALFSVYAQTMLVGALPCLLAILFGSLLSAEFALVVILICFILSFVLINMGTYIQLYNRAKHATDRRVSPFYYVVCTHLMFALWFGILSQTGLF